MTILTATQLRLMTMCERRIWLDKYGSRKEQIDVTSVTTIPFTAGIQHEEQIHTVTSPQMRESTVTSWQEAVEATLKALERNRNVIGACLEAKVEIQGQPVHLRGRIDRLQRVRDGSYYPIEIKSYHKLDAADRLQLAFYCFLVGQLQDKIPDGEFWLGAEVQVIQQQFPADQFYSALNQWVTIIHQQDAPPVDHNQHCRKCHWYNSCVDTLTQQRSVQLLHSIRRDTVKSLADKDIHTVDQFILLSLEEIRQVKGIKSKAERYLAQAKAYVNAAPQWYQDMPDILHNGGTMFDLETTAGGSAWSLGWSGTNGETHIAVVNNTHKQTSISLPDNNTIHIVRRANNAWYTLLDSIGDLATPIYHWTGFDAKVMADTAPAKVKKALLPRMHDLHRTFVDSVQLPVKSYSLKPVAMYFGFQWQGYSDWNAAYNDYLLWKTGDNQEALYRACGYQRDDVLALIKVWRWMIDSSSVNQ